MKRIWPLVTMFALAPAGSSGATDNPGPSPGGKAPDFSMEGSDGKTYKLSSFKRKRPVVIAWFPKAFTGA